MNVFVKIMGIVLTIIVGIVLLPFSPIIFVFAYVKGMKKVFNTWDTKIIDINDHKGE